MCVRGTRARRSRECVRVQTAAEDGSGHYAFVLRQLEDRAYSLLTYRLRQRLHRKVAELLQVN